MGHAKEAITHVCMLHGDLRLAASWQPPRRDAVQPRRVRQDPAFKHHLLTWNDRRPASSLPPPPVSFSHHFLSSALTRTLCLRAGSDGLLGVTDEKGCTRRWVAIGLARCACAPPAPNRPFMAPQSRIPRPIELCWFFRMTLDAT